MKFKIVSKYEYEIEAKDEIEAIEKFLVNIENELTIENKTLLTELVESLEAKKI